MSERKRFLLRIHPRLYRALEKWAADELRSVNAQVEYLLTEAAKRSGRLDGPGDEDGSSAGTDEDTDGPAGDRD
ncbi:MAG TPA: hypothetical protein VFF10_09935 [Trueperaceae bacterium]|nr:hypothetical protein [Trueperaceae bacterium]